MTTPFKINLSSKDIADLQQRLNNTRWPDQLDQPANNKWEYGSELNYMKELAKYWETTFLSNWKNKHEVHFNSLLQFTTNVEGHGTIHFIHEKLVHVHEACCTVRIVSINLYFMLFILRVVSL